MEIRKGIPLGISGTILGNISLKSLEELLKDFLEDFLEKTPISQEYCEEIPGKKFRINT